jgi:protein involved in ribonucleotide reduction
MLKKSDKIIVNGKEYKKIKYSDVLNYIKFTYSFLYENEENISNVREMVAVGDTFLENENNKEFITAVVNLRGDVFASDREVAALAYTLKHFELI